MEEVRISFKESAMLPLESLLAFQGKLKNLSEQSYEKLKHQILRLGFAEPFSIWEDPDGKRHLINGHQRSRVLKRMRDDEGIKLPELFPANIIEAETLERAKELVLSLTSQYGDMTEEGLAEFIADMPDIDLSAFRFPEINLDYFKTEVGALPNLPSIADRMGDSVDQNIRQMILVFDAPEFEEACGIVAKINASEGTETSTEAVLHALRYYEKSHRT